MDGNVEMLNYIYQNSQMGQDTLNQLIDIVEDKKFQRYLKSELKEYQKIFDTAEKKLEMSGSETKGVSPLSKASAALMIGMKTLSNKTPEHISEMLVQGSTMGIIDITKNLKKYNDADKDIIDLGRKLLAIEQKNVEELKRFL